MIDKNPEDSREQEFYDLAITMDSQPAPTIPEPDPDDDWPESDWEGVL